MIKPPYTLEPIFVRLDVLFQQLVQSYSIYEARALLTDWIEQGRIEVTPALLRGWRLCVLDDGGITIETADGDLDPATFSVRQRTLREVPPSYASQRAHALAQDRRRTEIALGIAHDEEPEAAPAGGKVLPLFGDRPQPEQLQPAPSETGKIQGQHKSADTAMAEAIELIAKIDAYQNEHGCTQREALTALYQELGHNSPEALKTALSRARKRVEGK